MKLRIIEKKKPPHNTLHLYMEVSPNNLLQYNPSANVSVTIKNVGFKPIYVRNY